MVKITRPSYSLGLYLAFAFAYYLTGYGVSYFSLHSQIIPIWLPAGIALVGCYIWWWRFIPGIFISSFLFNYTMLPESHSMDLLIEQGLPIAMMSVGACLQAFVGSALLRYWLGHPLSQSSKLNIVYFILFVGILVNLISSSIGTLSLTLFNPSFNFENYWINFLSWWMADSLGILLVAPFMFSFIHLEAGRIKLRRSRILILSSSLFIFFLISVLTALFVNFSNKKVEEATASEVSSIENRLYRELSFSTVQLQALASYIQNTPEVQRADFIRTVDELADGQAAISAMSWCPVIAQRDKNNHELSLRAIYEREIPIKGGSLFPDDPIVYVKYIVPEKVHKKAIGFNLFSREDRKQTLVDAELNLQARATPILQLIQTEAKEPAYIMFYPVFKDNRQLRGYVSGIFLAEEMIQNAIELSGHRMHFDYELYEAGKDHWFSSNNKGVALKGDPTVHELTFDLSGQEWHLYLQTNKAHLAQKQVRAYLLLFVLEFVIVAFVMLFILLMHNHQRYLNKEVSAKTKSLKLAMKEANLASSAKSRFLANMSHEIRTPMNAVVGFSQLARSETDLATIQSYLEKIEISSDLLLNIVNDILDISKIEADKLTLSYENFDIHQSLNRIDILFQAQALEKGLEWKMENNIPASLFFKGDQSRFEQVLVNLCSNALKFTPSGGVEVTADIQILNHQKSRIIVKVKDSGIGISDENKDKLFTAFTQADETTSRLFGGTGLGLALSKEFSQLMDGDIVIKDNESGGTAFIFECVMNCADDDFVAEHALLHKERESLLARQIIEPVAEEAAIKDNKEVGSKHLLVAEDNEINQIVIKAILENEGITADIVKNGQLAVAKVQEVKYDAVLMDCQMPVMDGYEATKAIRKIKGYEKLPIFALTADATTESQIKAKEVGFSRHLSKPIVVDELLKALNNI